MRKLELKLEETETETKDEANAPPMANGHDEVDADVDEASFSLRSSFKLALLA